MERRPLKSRGTAWASTLARVIARTGITPNQISLLSIVMALIALICHYYSLENKILLLVAVLFIQFRLLCNLIDGMVAVEHGKKTNTGEIYNDVPDRYADILIIMGFGLALRTHPYAIHLAWAASCFALITAYLRVLGKSLGTESYFSGPMAKPHRMFFICLFSIIEYISHLFQIDFSIGHYGLIFILIGTILTGQLRLNKILRDKNYESVQ